MFAWIAACVVVSVLALLLAGTAVVHWQHRREVSSDPAVAYDVAKYGHVLRWTKHCVFIRGKPTVLLSGEFHYWRVPDRQRWRPLLEQYKAAGLNCVRIYFHFGFHSPAEGKFCFDGNRDVDHVLNLCEELGLYVLAAPGPYICAETSGGGYPTWLVAKQQVRVRHSLVSLAKIYDDEFMAACRSWFEHIIPVLAKHEITVNPRGCVLMTQIENELLPMPFISILPFNYDRYMRELSLMARRAGCTVPLFHNDPMLLGNFIPGKGSHGMDIYSFDRYIVFPPVREQANAKWKDEVFTKGIDHTEVTARSFGGGQATAPIFVAELQGGWFHQYGSKGTYDGIYDFFGEAFTQNIMQSFMAQGSTMLSLYMFYGGTNWGTIGDPDVYTSYDYSACIREYGYLSGRLRQLRLFNLAVQAFNEQIAQTDRKTINHARQLECSIEDVLMMQRVSVADSTLFGYLRNFNKNQQDSFSLTLTLPSLGSNDEQRTVGPIVTKLAHRYSSIVVADHLLTVDGPRLLLSTVPILGKGLVDGALVLLVTANGGAVVLDGSDVSLANISGNVKVSLLKNESQVVINCLNAGSAEFSYTSATTGSTGSLVVLAITPEDSTTLTVAMIPPSATSESAIPEMVAAWGAYHILLQPKIESEQLRMVVKTYKPTAVHVLSSERFLKADSGFKNETNHSMGLRKWLKTKQFGELIKADLAVPKTLTTQAWQEAAYNWNSVTWKPIEYKDRQPLVHNFTGGHAMYRCRFTWDMLKKGSNLSLNINTRHRVSLWLNGIAFEGHFSYKSVWEDVQTFGPAVSFVHNFPLTVASSNGSDNWAFGGRKYNLSSALKPGENELLVVTYNFGMNRQTMASNDIRNPRGLVFAKFSPSIAAASWSIAGIDVTKLDEPFKTFGVPLEDVYTADPATNKTIVWETQANLRQTLSPKDGARWFRTTFDRPFGTTTESDGHLACPLHVSLKGSFSAYIYVNGHPIGHYQGDLGPQRHFYIMDGLVKEKLNQLALFVYTNETTAVDVQIAPYSVDHPSGNINDDTGTVFVYERHDTHL